MSCNHNWTEETATAQLRPNFVDIAGVLHAKYGYTPNDTDYCAINYLIAEWDYAYRFDSIQGEDMERWGKKVIVKDEHAPVELRVHCWCGKDLTNNTPEDNALHMTACQKAWTTTDWKPEFKNDHLGIGDNQWWYQQTKRRRLMGALHG